MSELFTGREIVIDSIGLAIAVFGHHRLAVTLEGVLATIPSALLGRIAAIGREPRDRELAHEVAEAFLAMTRSGELAELVDERLRSGGANCWTASSTRARSSRSSASR